MRYLIFLFITLTTGVAYAQITFTPFEEVLSRAEHNDESVLLVFSGSDWCKPCIVFKTEILESKSFIDSSSRLKVYYADFPYRKKNALPKIQAAHNERLAERYNPEGSFPKIVLLSSQHKPRRLNYAIGMTPDQFINQLKSK